jgi:cell wall-associated NlpC family hydrolase
MEVFQVVPRMCLLLASILAVPALLDSTQVNSAQVKTIAQLPLRTRAQIIATAKTFVGHKWTAKSSNLRASCLRTYNSDWKDGQQVEGIPYNWGGADTPEIFDRKLTQGLAAGSHSRYGVLSCTTGVDCSGFVAFCWRGAGTTHDMGTTTLRTIGGKPKDNWFTDLKPGDALVKPGSHVVLFAGYNPDGTINVYEASGSAARVIFHRTTWSRFTGYIPLRYKNIDE